MTVNRQRTQSSTGDGPAEAFAQDADLAQENDRLRRKLMETDLLLAEARHRLHSGPASLQMVIAEILRDARDPVLRGALDQMHRRVVAMRAAERVLSIDATGEEIEMLERLRMLTAELVVAFDASEQGIDLVVRGMPLWLPATAGRTLLFACNEIIGNAFRYAFRDRRGGRIEVLVRPADSHPRLIIRDDGVGISEKTLRSGGAGLWLIRTLVGHLGATLHIRSDNGTVFTIDLPDARTPGA